MSLRTQLSRRRESGQALIEFTFLATMMLVMLFAIIDFGRAIYEHQVLVNLTREASNLTSRGTTFADALTSMNSSCSPLSLTNKGKVFLSTIVLSNGQATVSSQTNMGLATASSRIGSVNGRANMPTTSPTLPVAGQTIYATEIFYSYSPITPLGKLLKIAFPTNLYDVAYF